MLKEDGSFEFTWLSRSVNGENPYFDGSLVPEEMREPIKTAFTSAVRVLAGSET